MFASKSLAACRKYAKQKHLGCTKGEAIKKHQLSNFRSRLTVVNRQAKKKQHAYASSGLRDHYSELFTQMAAIKF